MGNEEEEEAEQGRMECTVGEICRQAGRQGWWVLLHAPPGLLLLLLLLLRSHAPTKTTVTRAKSKEQAKAGANEEGKE